MNENLLSANRAFVIGWPIKHSRSPLIHSYWLKALGLTGSYEKIAVPPADLEDFLTSLESRGFAGGNITLPHKERAFELCRRTSSTAAALGAVNTIWLEKGELCGDNTDVAGFLACLDQEAPGWDAACRTALVLGAGGAARAIVQALMLRSKPKIYLVNRTRARAEDLARKLPGEIMFGDFSDLPEILAKADVLVNTTSLGMAGEPPLAIDLAPLPRSAIVSDIVYVPLETDLVRNARSRGLKAIGGLGMLLHQAVPGFETWFGKRPQVTEDLRNLIEADILASAQRAAAQGG